jgi:hypothetical protein
MNTDTKDADRAEVMRKLRQTALERQKYLRDLADVLPQASGEANSDLRIRIAAAAQLRQLAGE